MFQFRGGVGTFVVDIRLKAIGRIRRASGTKDRETFRAIITMLKQLHATGKHSVLREIQSGLVSPIEVYGYWIQNQLDHLPSASSLQPIQSTFNKWIETHDVIATTKRNYKSEITRFVAVVGDIPISDLAAGVAHYKVICRDSDKARTFSALRTALLAFLRANKHTQLWKEVSDIKPLKVERKKQAPQLTVVEAHSLLHTMSKKYADVARAMLFSGMHWKEVVGKWEFQRDRIVIHGTKAAGRERIVPIIQSFPPVTCSNISFRRALRKVRPDLSPYSFRRTYAHWMEMAGIPRARRIAYLGHGKKDTTDLYEAHQIEAYLQEDAKTFRNYVFEQWKKSKEARTSDKRPSKIEIL